MGACALITLPLELVLGARVYRSPRRLLRAIGPPAVLFYLWDAAAVARGHWSYAARYVTGFDLPGAVPVEELVFFLVVPICALLTYEAVDRILSGRLRRERRHRNAPAARAQGPSGA